MSQRKSEVAVGVAFLAAMVLLGVYTIAIKGLSLFGETKSYLVQFDQVYGLKEGDPVRVEGKEVGEVTSLRLLPEGDVLAGIEVPAEVEIYKDGGEVRVQPFSPLGGRVVEIKRGKPSPAGKYDPVTAEDEPGEVRPIGGVAEGELLQTLNELVETNKADVRKIVANIERVSRQLTKTDNVLGYLLNDELAARKLSEATNSLSSAAQRVDRIVARVEEGQGVVGGLLKEGSPLQRNIEGAAAAADRSLDSLGTILARAERGESALGVVVGDAPETRDAVKGIVSDVRTITHEVAEGDGTLGKLVRDGRLYESAAGTMENLDTITGRIEGGGGILSVLTEKEAGEDVRQTLRHLSSITAAVDDPEAGTLGLLVHDQALRGRIARVATEIEGLVVEFRDTLEDSREQAPVNAFIGAVFAAF